MIEPLSHHRRSRVFIADDTESVRSLFERLLSGDGHDVVSAPDGRSALEAIQLIARTSSSSTSRCQA